MEFIRPMPTWDDIHQVPAAREMFQNHPERIGHPSRNGSPAIEAARRDHNAA